MVWMYTIYHKSHWRDINIYQLFRQEMFGKMCSMHFSSNLKTIDKNLYLIFLTWCILFSRLLLTNRTNSFSISCSLWGIIFYIGLNISDNHPKSRTVFFSINHLKYASPLSYKGFWDFCLVRALIGKTNIKRDWGPNESRKRYRDQYLWYYSLASGANSVAWVLTPLLCCLAAW